MKKRYSWLIFISIVFFTLSGCNMNKDDEDVSAIAESYYNEDKKILDEAEKFLSDSNLKESDYKTYSDYVINVFNQTSDKHIIEEQNGGRLLDLSISALSKDLQQETQSFKYISRREEKLSERLKAARWVSRNHTGDVTPLFNKEIASEYLSRIEKLDQKYEAYREAKGIEEY